MDTLNKKTSLFKLSYGCRVLFIITLLLSIFEIFLRTYMPTFIQKIIDLLNSEDLSSNKSMIEIEVQKNILILISFGLLIGISTITGSYLNVIARYRYAKNLRYALFTKVQNFSFQDIDKYPTGVIVNYLNTDVDNIAKVFRIFSVPLIKMPVMFLSALIFALNQSIELSIIFSVSLPILFIFFIIMWKYGMPIFYRTFKKSDEYNNKLQENLHSIKVIKSYVTELKEQKKHDSINNEMGEISIKGEKIFTWYHIVTMNTIFMSLITLVLIGVNQVLENKITPGTIVSFSTYIWMITGSFMAILNITSELFRSIPSMKRYKQIINYQSSIQEIQNPIIKSLDGDIEFKNVSLKYENAQEETLKYIDLTIPKGSSLGIVGKTSSGKTSLLNLITRFYEVSNGEVLIDNINVKEYSLTSLRSQISGVFQNSGLFTGSIRENMLIGNPNASDEEIINVLKQASIWEFVNNQPEKLDYVITQSGNNLSGGQKQRFYIARALLKKAKILILDDATSAIDAKTEQEIKLNLNNIKEVTKIIVAQKISSVLNCDQILVIDEGKISDIGTHSELMLKNKYYREMYEIQNSLGSLNEV